MRDFLCIKVSRKGWHNPFSIGYNMDAFLHVERGMLKIFGPIELRVTMGAMTALALFNIYTLTLRKRFSFSHHPVTRTNNPCYAKKR